MLLYAPCTVNTAFLQPYEPSIAYTPRLADFARDAVVFERHMTEEGQSGLAYASIFSGRQSDGHGIFYHPSFVRDDGPWMTQVFHDGGFYVSAWLQHQMASPELGYGRGADEEHMEVLAADSPDFEALLSRLRDDPSARALVVVNHILVHSPFRLVALDGYCGAFPEDCGVLRDDPVRFHALAQLYHDLDSKLHHDFPAVVKSRGLSEDDIETLARVIELLYRSNVWQLDAHFGTLLDAVAEQGLEDESLVVFTADHGEAFYREGLLFPFSHGFQLAPEVLHVPLLVRGAGLAPRRYGSVTRSTDLLPTLASLAGLAPPPLPDLPWNGVDLSAALRGDEREPALEAYSHTAMLAGSVLEASADWAEFRRYFPREDPELMWAQIRAGDTATQLRYVADRDTDHDADSDSMSLKQVFLELDTSETPKKIEETGGESEEQKLRWERLRIYRQTLIDGWNERIEERAGPQDEVLDEEREKELLRSLGYIDD